jgi:DNA topoisomerase-1
VVAVALPPVDPVQAAAVAGLRYVADTGPGIRRHRRGKGFAYTTPDGKPLTSSGPLTRIRSLAIPPAWTDVWICPSENGHIQATGRDARGRKQYRYHPRWREVRDETKYHRSIAFGKALPRIRARVEVDLGRPALPREKVLAAVVSLLDRTYIRVGNEEYARDNGSVGLTTMKDGHVKIDGSSLRFRFKGKSGKPHDVELADRRLAKIVKDCRDIPGQDLFQYVDDDGEIRSIGSSDVNDYLREIAGEEFTAKDFRTWAGTVLAATELAGAEAAASDTAAKRVITRAVGAVAEKLGNTVAVCRKCYVHPAVLEAYRQGGLPRGRVTERAVLRMLEKRAARMR